MKRGVRPIKRPIHVRPGDRSRNRGKQNECGVIGTFRPKQDATARDRVLAATVGFRRRRALPFQAAVHGFGSAGPAEKAVEGPSQQNNRQHADCNLNTTPHLMFPG